MPLSDPAPRRLLHRRAIELLGYARDDGLFEVEASLTDTKSYPFRNHDRGEINPGTPLHHMLTRMTFDSAMLIHRFEAATEFRAVFRLSGRSAQFRVAGRADHRARLHAGGDERIGGVKGCTHLRELLGQMGTVALQTVVNQRMERNRTTVTRPAQLNTCLAYEDGGVVARRVWPEYYAQVDADVKAGADPD